MIPFYCTIYYRANFDRAFELPMRIPVLYGSLTDRLAITPRSLLTVIHDHRMPSYYSHTTDSLSSAASSPLHGVPTTLSSSDFRPRPVLHFYILTYHPQSHPSPVMPIYHPHPPTAISICVSLTKVQSDFASTSQRPSPTTSHTTPHP